VALLALGLAACGPGGGGPSAAAKDPGITDTQILLGGTHPLTGGASFYGTIGKAAEAYFNYINDQGGVNGRKIVYKNPDDAYTPANTVQLTKQLVEQDQVFAMFNGLGTPPQTAVQPYLNQKKVPQVFVATGAAKWGLDYKNNPWTIGWQPNYISESIIYAKHLLKTNPDNAKIAVLYQNDDYGEDYLNGLTRGLGNKANLIIAKKSYEATAADVNSEVAALKASNANTFFVFATPKYSAQALGVASRLGWKPTIYLNNVSNPQLFMNQTTKAVPGSTTGVLSTAYLKDPADPKWADDAGVKLYKKVMAQYYSSGDPNDGFNFYGMGAAFTMVDALKKAGKNLSRTGLMDAVTHLNETDNPFVLPGVVVKTTPTDRFPITQETLERFDGSKWVPFGDLIDTRGQLT
jgi:branched-chain amino acid transport system substrate-binding protein